MEKLFKLPNIMINPIVDVIIPAFNEENAIGRVINEVPKEIVRDIIVINNNSTDQTSTIAKDASATVLDELKKGYGNACLKGLSYLHAKSIKPDIVVFLDADYSDYPEEIAEIINPIISQNKDLVIGSQKRLRHAQFVDNSRLRSCTW